MLHSNRITSASCQTSNSVAYWNFGSSLIAYFLLYFWHRYVWRVVDMPSLLELSSTVCTQCLFALDVYVVLVLPTKHCFSVVLGWSVATEFDTCIAAVACSERPWSGSPGDDPVCRCRQGMITRGANLFVVWSFYCNNCHHYFYSTAETIPLSVHVLFSTG